MTPDEIKELMDKNLITQVINPVDVVNNMETPPTGGCDCTDYVLPTASATTLGGVKIGDGLDIDADGKLGVNIGSALGIDLDGDLSVKIGDGLAIDAYGNLYATSGSDYTLPIATAATLGGVKVGSALGIDDDGALKVKLGSGLCYNDEDTGVSIKTGNGLDLAADGTLYAIGGGSDYTLSTASMTTLGGVKIGAEIFSQKYDQYVPIGIDSTTGEIGVNIGPGLGIDSTRSLKVKIGNDSGLGINSNGELYVTNGGGGDVKVGTGLYVDATNSDALCVDTASATTLGGVKIGDGLAIGTDGKLYVTATGSDYELPKATKTTLGGIIVGTGLTIDPDGKLGLSYASNSTSGLVKIGNGLYMKDGNWISVNCGTGLDIHNDGKLYVTATGSDYTLPTASMTTLGGVKVANNAGVSIGSDGTLFVNHGDGLTVGSADGKLVANIGSAMFINHVGQLCVNKGIGLDLDDNNNTIKVKYGNGLDIDANASLIANIDYIYEQILAKLKDDGYIQ